MGLVPPIQVVLLLHGNMFSRMLLRRVPNKLGEMFTSSMLIMIEIRVPCLEPALSLVNMVVTGLQ